LFFNEDFLFINVLPLFAIFTMEKIKKESSTPLPQPSKENGRIADQPPKEAVKYIAPHRRMSD
jgi:hypothetical protein